MQREPLKDLQTGSVSSRQTMKRTPDKAATTAAAKILNSAKKSLTKHCAKKVKLSLQKASGCTAHSKPSARALAFDPLLDLNDTVEFKKKVPVVSLPKLQLATRKRKKPPQDAEGEKVKIAKQEVRKAASDTTEQCHELIPDQSTTDQNVLKSCSAQRIQAPNLHRNASTASPEAGFSSARLGSDGGVKVEEDESQTDSQSGADLSTTLHTCPACGKLLRHGKFVRHIQMCIKQHREDEDQVPDTMSKEESSDHNSGTVSTVEDETESLSLDYVFCQLCQKDLSHLNSHRRVLHINKCMDEEEKKKEEMEERQRALEAAKTQVLDCPMCGKVLRTVSSRTAHLKKCAAALGVGPEQLLAAVKRQEEEHLATLAAGILPSRPGNSARQNPSGTRRGVGGLPKSKLDEDTQLALALSSSLKPDAEEAGTSAAANSRRGRKNKQEEDYLLLKLSASQAAGRIETRISDLLMMEMENEEEYIPALPQLDSHSLHGQTVHWSASAAEHCKFQMFWRLASLEQHCEGTEDNSGDPSKFYVSALMPPVQMSTVAAGSKIRRMSEIPGRRRSLDARSNTEVLPHDEQIMTLIAQPSIRAADKLESKVMYEWKYQYPEPSGVLTLKDQPENKEDQDKNYEDENLPPFSTQTAALLADMAAEKDENLPPFSTQTAALLADMAAENDGIDQSTQLSSPQFEISDLEQQVHEDLLSAFSSLVNHQGYSDVVIQTAESVSLHAHRIILSVRCPALLQLDAGSGEIDLREWSPGCVLAMLRFLYAGETKVDRDCLPATLQLAHRFGLASFEQICRYQLDSLAASEVPSCSAAERKQQNPYTSSNSSFTNIRNTATQEADDRKDTAASGVGGDENCGEPEPPVLEYCPPISFPRKVQFMHVNSPRKRRTPDRNHDIHFPPGTASRGMETEEDPRDFQSQYGTGTPVADGVKVMTPRKVLQPTLKHENLLEEVHEVTNNAGEIVSVKPPTHTAGCSVFSEAKKQKTDGVNEVCGMMDTDEDASIFSPNHAGHTAAGSNQGQAGGFCEGVSEFVSLQRKKEGGYQPKSDDAEIRENEKANTSKMHKSSSPFSRQSGMQSSQDVEPVESIEISDEDLFSTDDEVSLFPMSPAQSTKQNFKEDGTGAKCDRYGNTSDADKESCHVLSDSECVQKITQNEPSHKATVEDNSCERTKTENTSRLMAKNTNLLTINPLFEQQRHQQPSIDDSLSCESISAIEYSYQRSSLTSPKHRNFQTSTPELCFEDGQTRRRTDGKMKLRGERDVPGTCTNNATRLTEFARSEESFIESNDLVNLRDKTLENETTWKPENKQTPCASVIEQDSLYVTPLVEGRAMRRTFQLVTPSPQQAGAGCPAKTPVSHCEAKKSELVPSASRSDLDIDDEEKRKLHKETVSRDSQPKQNCLPEQSPSDSHSSQPELKKTEDSFVGGDSDSDLEIIDTSIQNMPSPKFGLSCSQTQSQVASQSLKLSLPENRSKPSPDKAVSLSQTRSPVGTKSVGQRLEHHREYDRSPRPLHSPSRISPSDLLSRFSQRSSESDKELLRVTELLCGEAEEDQCVTSGKGDAESLCDSDINDVNRSKEDIWDGFDNLDDYNPDLYLEDLEKNTADISINKQEQSSPQPNLKSVSECLSKTEGVQVATSPFKTPTKSPRKSKEMSARKAAAKVDTPKGVSSQNQIMYKKINYECVSPVKAQSSASRVSMSSRTACDSLEVSTSCGEKNAQSEYAPSRGFLIREGDGFLFADEDTEAANSSFLWSEENAPTEDRASCDQEDFKWTGLELGREGTACTQEAERLLVQTPLQTKQTSKGGKSTRVPPSPFTPMPRYDAMTTPELKIEVQKFGLKPVGKKRMKMVLKDIYQKTHQYETDSDYEEDSSHLPNLGPPILHKETDLDRERRKAPVLHRESNRPRSRPRTVQAEPPPSLQKQSKKEQSHAARHSRKPPTLAPQTVQRQEAAGEPPILCREADRSKPVKKPKTKKGHIVHLESVHNKKKNYSEPGEPQSTKRIQHQSRETEPNSRLECPDLSHFLSPAKTGPAEGGRSKTAHSEFPTKSTASYGSSPEKGMSSSQDSDASEQPDVSIFEEERLDSDDNEDITPSQQLAAKDLPRKLMGFIQGHPDWYHKVLKYEPLDLGVLKEDMKAAGIKCSQEKLLDFLDEKCITFTTKNMIPRKQRSRGKRPQPRKHAASQK